jgi:hypothetical protein
LNKFRDICQNEDKVGDLSDELQIKKVYNMIKKLKQYKDFLFGSMYKDEIENAKEIKIIESKNINRGIKNKFESNREVSNINFQKGQFIHIEPQRKKKIYHTSDKKIYNSFTNFNRFNFSHSKKLGKNVKQANSKNIINAGKFKIKQKFLDFPVIEDTDKIDEKDIININSDEKKMNSENRVLNYNSKRTRIVFPKNEKKEKIISKNLFLESKRMNKNINSEYNLESNLFGAKTSNISSNFINLDNISNIFYNQPQINERNWVAKVLIDNLVYNHVFDKYAFSSFNNYENFNSTQYNPNRKLKMSLGLNSINQSSEGKPKNKRIFVKSIDKSPKINNNKNKIISNIFSKKQNKSLSKSNISEEDKIKNIKLKIKKKDEQIDKSKNGIYDVLIFDDFNKCFNETIYKKFLEA